VHGVRGPEEVDPGHLAHAVVGDQQRHRLVLARQVPQRRQTGGGGRFGDDPEVFPESPAEVVVECAHDPGIVIDHEQHGRWHQAAPRLTRQSRWAGCSG
jgi:hypothetical protein